MTERLRIARVVERSTVNGPGERFVIWVQGCALRCPGCWNPHTWPRRGGDLAPADALVDRMRAAPGLEGVTFTGGEPMDQAAALAPIARAARADGLSVFVFTGYELDELTDPAQKTLVALADVVVTGRYDAVRRDLSLGWRGSTNQQVHFVTDRYSPADEPGTSICELHIDATGALTITGFPDDGLRSPFDRL